MLKGEKGKGRSPLSEGDMGGGGNASIKEIFSKLLEKASRGPNTREKGTSA